MLHALRHPPTYQATGQRQRQGRSCKQQRAELQVCPQHHRQMPIDLQIAFDHGLPLVPYILVWARFIAPSLSQTVPLLSPIAPSLSQT
jgi:hypothetical protein